MKDVSAFANTSGGNLIYGVEENAGFPTRLDGIASTDVENDILQIESILRANLQPRLPKLDVRWIEKDANKGFLVIEVGKSWVSPHCVTYKNHSKFYARNSAGVYQMDVDDLRSAFFQTERLPQSIRDFRDQRLSTILAGDTPILITPGIWFVLHIFPLASFTQKLDLAPNRENAQLPPINGDSFNMRHMIDGFVCHSSVDSQYDSSNNYSLTFRDGKIESVFAIEDIEEEDAMLVRLNYSEKIMIDEIEKRLRWFESLAIEGPYYIYLSLLHAKGWRAWKRQRYPKSPAIQKNTNKLPEVEIGDHSASVPEAMRPIFDILSNAFGRDKSWSYDEAGNWQEREI